MALSRLLIANRGEIAIRIARSAADAGVHSVAIAPEDDAESLHLRKADEALGLPGRGAAAYLDTDAVLAAAREARCDAVHPGYGFLSENAAFAFACAEAGVRFVGPRPETLELFGDKARARALAQRCEVPVLDGTQGPTTLEQAEAFRDALPEGASLVIKAIAGGGGRGMRIVERGDDLAKLFERCQSEARAAFGNGDVFVERRIERARHVEVQVIGDGTGAVAALGERECSVQRRHQKLVEIAPCPGLPEALRAKLIDCALRMAGSESYTSLGTFEFLIEDDGSGLRPDSAFAFIEANPRLQVEHTVTEEVFGVDLVRMQLRIAAGASLKDLGLSGDGGPVPRGFAIQTRINMETLAADGSPRPSGGTLTAFEPPSGPGVRCDSFGYAGYRTSARYDSLLAKLICHEPSNDFAAAVRRSYRALCEFRIEGFETNRGLLQNLLLHPDFAASRVYTRFVDERIGELLEAPPEGHRTLYAGAAATPAASPAAAARAGVRLDSTDPLAVLEHGKSGAASAAAPAAPTAPAPAPALEGPDGTRAVPAPLQGTIVSLSVAEGDAVRQGQALLVMEAMKMEHVIEATESGVVRVLAIGEGDTVFEGHPLAFIEPGEVDAAAEGVAEAFDPDHVRDDLREVLERQAMGLDERRPDAVARRRKTNQRTARENLADLCDPDSYIEYGRLAIAAQRRRRTLEDLIERTPADGMLAGVGRINGDRFPGRDARAVICSYDYTVLAGTQGLQNHRKKDRLFEIAEHNRLPVVFFTEGGGGRPGDTDGPGGAGLDCWAFHYFGRLSGLVPLIGINSGRCFAGNAALLGCCDVVIATANSNIGMGGPAMVEGGGLGVFRPDEIGAMDDQVRNGVVDIPVADEAEAVAVARQYLSYFQGPVPDWECADQRLLRGCIPENRLRIYDVRQVIETLADTGSVLELRRAFGTGMVTALARIGGRPLGIVANNPVHLAGAIDSDGADKATRFMQLCDAHDLPLLFLCDTPGIMVGPEIEKTALVRHAARMFVTSASLTVPFFTIVLRKGYGLGAQAMAGGSFKAPFFTVSWPTGEFGGMGLEGAVKLGYRNELAAIEDPEERKALYDKMVERMYQHGKAISTGSFFEIDDVIDPMDSRRWIESALESAPPPAPRTGKKRPCVDTW